MNPFYDAMSQQSNVGVSPQQISTFKEQMQKQGITDPKAEVMRRVQSGMLNMPQMQRLRGLMQMLGLNF